VRFCVYSAEMALTPRQIALAGWLGFMVYAFPGYMSYDSVYQLQEARWDYYSDGHPPAMAELWRRVDYMLAGPLGMLVIQSVCFLAGAYLIFRTRMQPRGAALAAVLTLWFPPIAAFMAVIWKDSQMVAFIVLGLGLLLTSSRRLQITGLVVMALGTAMRHNALAMTLPLIGLLFVWNEAHPWWKRYAIAIVAWLAVTLAARAGSNALTDNHRYLWTNSIAMCDIAATLRYTEPTIPDDKLRELFDGARIWPDKDLHAVARRGDEEKDFVVAIWDSAYRMFAVPHNEAERDAVVRAWKRIVLTHPHEFLTYRWKLFQRLIGLTGDTGESPVYNWFTDIQDPYGSAARIDHDAAAGKIQNLLRRAMHWIGTTAVFRVIVYLALALLLLPFCVRDRLAFALIASGLSSEAILFLIAPTTDWRYSCWLILCTTFAAILIITRRAHSVWVTASKMKQ
jgi:hypothetical protein